MSGDGRERFAQRAVLWRWIKVDGASLFFLRFTGEAAAAISALALIRRLETGRRRGWGGLRGEARIGKTRWPTMVVPGDNESWLLPVKREVREAEGLREGDDVAFEVCL